MTKVNDGGPAFPERRCTKVMATGPNGQAEPIMETVGGMSLRDWFAGQAMVGLTAHPKCGPVGHGYETATNCVAREAYALADALLSERSKAGGEQL